MKFNTKFNYLSEKQNHKENTELKIKFNSTTEGYSCIFTPSFRVRLTFKDSTPKGNPQEAGSERELKVVRERDRATCIKQVQMRRKPELLLAKSDCRFAALSRNECIRRNGAHNCNISRSNLYSTLNYSSDCTSHRWL